MLCVVPKGAAKIVPEESTEPPPNEEIEETNEASEEDEKGDEEMDVDGSDEVDEVAHALAAVRGLTDAQGNQSSTDINDLSRRVNEIMRGYDREDNGFNCIGTGGGDLYYPSNKEDPYLQNQDDDEEEEVDDMIIKPTDGVIVCRCVCGANRMMRKKKSMT